MGQGGGGEASREAETERGAERERKSPTDKNTSGTLTVPNNEQF